MKKLFERIVDFMQENGSTQSEYKDVYMYALQTVAVYAFNIGTGIVIGVVLGELLYCMIFLTAFMLLRQEAGGYHAPGWISCYFLSCGILVLTLLWIKAEFPYQTYFTIVAALAAGIGIFLFAPREDRNKPLEEAEKKVIGKKARIIVVTELILGMVFLAENQRAAYAVLGAVIWCGVSYLAWSVKRYAEKNGKSREDNN